jgi:hypothetical protein
MALHPSEALLCSLLGVVDAKVWEKNGTLVGWVAVLSESGWTGSDLQTACFKKLGPDQSPQLIMVSQVETPAIAA